MASREKGARGWDVDNFWRETARVTESKSPSVEAGGGEANLCPLRLSPG